MKAKLKCVIVDDDLLSIEAVKDLCRNSPQAEIAYSYTSPEKFMEERSKLTFDVCLLDIVMPEIDGFTLCSSMDKPVILMTGVLGKIVDAVDMVSPIDVLRKPIKKERFEIALKKARNFIGKNPVKEQKPSPANEYELFKSIVPGGKISIKLSDILYVKTQTDTSRNKFIALKGGGKYILSDVKFEELLALSPNLVRVNKSELISLEAFHKIANDLIVLKKVIIEGKPKKVYLNRWFRKDFLDRISSRNL